MPINESENKNISTNTNSSTDNIENIKINEITNAVSSGLNTISNTTIENYNLDEPELSNEGILNRNDLDFSRIANTAGNAKDGNFITVKNPEYWGDTGDLTYKIRDDGTVAISEDGVILGFTDLQGIRIKEADSSKTDNIEKNETSKTNLVPGEEPPAEIIEEVKEEPIETVEEELIKEEPAPEVLEEKVVEEPQVETYTAPQTTSDGTATTINIPGDLRQSGISKNYTNYSYYYNKWNKGTGQRAVADMWDAAGKPNKNGIATLNDRYLVAVTSTFGKAGDIIDVVLRDGTVIPCIIADAKGAGPTNEYGHVLGGGGTDIIEWESYGSKENIIIDEWHAKGVEKIINKGSIFTN